VRIFKVGKFPRYVSAWDFASEWSPMKSYFAVSALKGKAGRESGGF
jgi:hypothetical protein